VRIADGTRSALASLRVALDSPAFTWNGVDIPCVPNTLGAGTVVAMGGFDETISIVLHVDLSTFLTADSTLVSADSTLYTADGDMRRPVAGRTLIFRGKTLRIVRTSVTPDNASVAVFLADENA
jgi:hypothetical protein